MCSIRFVPILLILVAVAVLGAAPSLAGGGKGHGNGHGGKPLAATLTVSPENPLWAWGQEYEVTGYGFKGSTSVNIVMSDPFCCRFFTVPADADGNVWFRTTTGQPGTYEIDAYQRLNGKKLTLMGTVSFAVTQP